jgi:hypothetical protein
VRELRRETGIEARVVDLLGLYLLCGHLRGDEEDLPDLLTYAFRCELVSGSRCSTAAAASTTSAGTTPAACPSGSPRPPPRS